MIREKNENAGTILVVDDEPTVLDYVDVVLRVNGYGVLRAENGDRALEICAATTAKLSLVLTDIQMPGMSGRVLARCLAGNHPQVPVIFMTGYQADSENWDASGSEPRLDGKVLIRKPFSPETLIKSIKGVLGT